MSARLKCKVQSAKCKIFGLALLLTFNFLLFTSPVLAQSAPTTIDINPKTWGADKQSAFTINTLPFAGICLLAQTKGCPVTVLENGGTTTKQVDKGPNGGAIMALANLTTTFYQVPPTSSVEYLANLGGQFGLGEPAYAQSSVGGSGEGIIKPVYNLWLVTRNISYLAFILIFIVIGFMIMFRQKISQQAVISAQAALPGLIVSLALVTFSYFISALMVDSAFLGTKLVGYIFSTKTIQLRDPKITNPNDPKYFVENRMGDPVELANNSNMFTMFGNAVGNIPATMGELLSGTFYNSGQTATGVTVGLGVIGTVIGTLISVIGGPIGWLIGGGAVIGAAAPIILSLLVGLILLIALAVQLFKLFFALINTYIQLLVFTIAGPLMIAFSAIPGKGGGMSFWIRGTIANALVFPAVFATFLFAGLILSNTNGADWQVSPPLFANLPAELLRVILAYGIILGTPAIPGIVRDVFKVKGPQAFAQAAMGGAMAGVGIGRSAIGGGVSRASRMTGLQSEKQAIEKREMEEKYNALPDVGAGQGLRSRLVKWFVPTK